MKPMIFQRIQEVEITHVRLQAPMPVLGMNEPVAILCNADGQELEGVPLTELLQAGWVPKTITARKRLRDFCAAHNIPVKSAMRLAPNSNVLVDTEDEPKAESPYGDEA